eukprot:CAMPEP_0119548570 /NCGR_PEP_ID=MMETSP1352-20130426/2457_1 /TAXON_ID=265584 /ORGANISM="Stauroneis constricta, Strain CCMP1120" /LENGTH=724 /DNA_ID=CAMNT_0007593879 /DNA_START=287 /DNA_END=2461 /DNA_ORIENTATION=+
MVSSSNSSSSSNGRVMKSPFFRPTDRSNDERKYEYTQTPQGKHFKVTSRRNKKSKTNQQKASSTTETKETKSTLIGCAANLINAIVGSGIVGLPYAIQQAGFCAGVILVILCAILTDKSLRLLIETAKHAQVPTYERVSEAAFGRYGFLFVAINMFIMAYGAMLSYLMIVKDTFSLVLGVDMDNIPMKRAILFLISITIIVPLSSQRDMADLAKTSRMNVTFDLLMVAMVLYCAPIREGWERFDWTKSIIKYDTIFVGLGVLSFAFVCQHSSFIIAGSLERPTQARWSVVTRSALTTSACLALLCGVGGFIGFQEKTQGNILNSMDDSFEANVARALLGTTMLFVYPMESFVARHVCVVLFFQGRSAHDGDDSRVLNRRDRRITLTVFLYLISVVPAALCQDLGIVLAAAGAVGGSCLSYIGPGAIYLGIHGGRFLKLSRSFFGTIGLGAADAQAEREEETPLYRQSSSNSNNTATDGEDGHVGTSSNEQSSDSWIVIQLKRIMYYTLLMPIWCWIAGLGKSGLTDHVHDLAMKSPHPIRIGNVRYASARLQGGATRVVMMGRGGGNGNNNAASANAASTASGINPRTTDDLERQHNSSAFPTETILLRADSIPKGFGTARTTDGRILALPAGHKQIDASLLHPPAKGNATTKQYNSIDDTIGAQLVKQKAAEHLGDDDEDDDDLEDDPQEIPPGVGDFAMAIFYIVFGVLALVAGLLSIAGEE